MATFRDPAEPVTNSLFFQNNTTDQNALEFRQLTSGLVERAHGVDGNSFEVTDPNSGDNISVRSGTAFIRSSSGANEGVYHAYLAANNTVALTAQASQSRIDSICLSADDSDFDGTNDNCRIVIVEGDAGASPSAPNLASFTTELGSYLHLADVEINSTGVIAVTDKRWDWRQLLPENYYSFSGYSTSNITAAAGTGWDSVAFGDFTARNDPAKAWTSGDYWTCPKAGIYTMYFSWRSSADWTAASYSRIYNSSTSTELGGTTMQPAVDLVGGGASTSTRMSMVAPFITLAANDQIKFQWQIYQSGTRYVDDVRIGIKYHGYAFSANGVGVI